MFSFLASCFLGLSTNQITIEDLNDGEVKEVGAAASR
jgi:hypothetical protein